MQNENKTTFLQKILNAPTILSLIAIIIQCAMYSKPYVTATYFHNTSILDMWDMFISSRSETNYFFEMLTFLLLFEITSFVPILIIDKKPTFTIILAIINILMIKTVPFFWDGVFSTKGLEATTGYYGFLVANIIVIVGAHIASMNCSKQEKCEKEYCEAKSTTNTVLSHQTNDKTSPRKTSDNTELVTESDITKQPKNLIDDNIDSKIWKCTHCNCINDALHTECWRYGNERTVSNTSDSSPS